MNNEMDDVKAMSHSIRFLGMTGEYFCGIIVGFGAGVVTMTTLSSNRNPIATIVGFLLICVGSATARHIQKQHASPQNNG